MRSAPKLLIQKPISRRMIEKPCSLDAQLDYVQVSAIKHLKEYLTENGFKNVFLVTGKTSYLESGAKKTLDRLSEELGLSITIFSDYSPNPKIFDVVKGLTIFKSTKPDVVVAIGGGSSIDMAKLISIMAAQDNAQSPQNLIENPAQLEARQIPLVAIPTTCGSGSEATHFAVIYVDGVKYSLDHPSLMPNLALVDPELIASLPPQQIAATGLDALSQAIEAYWSVNATLESQKNSRLAIGLVLRNLTSAVRHHDLATITALAKAAHIAGQAINIAKTTAAHAVSYKLTSDYHISHGHAVALTLPEFLVFNAGVSANDCNDTQHGPDFVRAQIDELVKMLKAPNVVTARLKLRKLINNCGLKTSLRELNIPQDELLEIANSVDSVRLANNPRKLSVKQLYKILLNIY